MGLEWKGDEDEGKKVSIEAGSKITFKNNHIYKKNTEKCRFDCTFFPFMAIINTSSPTHLVFLELKHSQLTLSNRSSVKNPHGSARTLLLCLHVKIHLGGRGGGVKSLRRN